MIDKVRIVGSPLGTLYRRVREVTATDVLLRGGSDPERILRFGRASGCAMDGSFGFDARIHPDDLAALGQRKASDDLASAAAEVRRLSAKDES